MNHPDKVLATTREAVNQMADEGWMTAAEISKQIGATEYSASRAILALGLSDSGKKDIGDRRRIIYPPGTLEKVRQWLETH